VITKDKLAALQCEGQEHIAAARKIAEKHPGDPNSWPADAIPRVCTPRRTSCDRLNTLIKKVIFCSPRASPVDHPAGSFRQLARSLLPPPC
jgi:hypothetical protein